MGIIGGEKSAAEITAEHIAAEKDVEISEEEVAEQVESAQDTFTELEETTNPLVGKFKADEEELKKKAIERPTKAEQKAEVQKVIVREDAEKSALAFEQKNPELKKEVLLLLLKKAVDCKNKDDLLTLINQFYPDPTLADEALDYLLNVATGQFKEMVQEAKTAFQDRFGREITAGRNINEEVRQYSAKGLGEPTQLRNLYRDLTASPREATTLYRELLERYKTQNMRTVISYLYHAIGSDLKKGPSIETGLLHNLLTEVRSLQAGLGLQRFFMNRMKLISFLFEKSGIPLPKELTYEAMSLQFVSLLEERYPSSDKVLQVPTKLGLDKSSTLAKIIVLSQNRDAVREVAINLFYRSIKHRDELLDSILTALENLEQQYDEEIEQQYSEEDKPVINTEKEEERRKENEEVGKEK
jgi:type III secretion protein W